MSATLAKRLKGLMPRGLFGRTLLILVLPLAVLQALVAGLVVERHWGGVTRQLSEGFAGEMRLLAGTIEAAPTEAARQRAVVAAREALGFELRWTPDAALPADPGMPRGLISRQAEAELRGQIDRPLFVQRMADENVVAIAMQLDGGVLSVRPPERLLVATKPHLLLAWMIGAGALLLLVAVLFLRNQVRPVKALANAAEAFGKGAPAPPFKPSGAEEVRRAAHAFAVMRARIERAIAQRTLMLSGVSHDLRTPLTRMRLALEMAEPGPDTDALRSDVDEMERMVEAFLAFARGEGTEEPVETDLVALVDQAVEDARRQGLAVDWTPPEGEARAALRPLAVLRCVENLLGNAAKYASRARVTLGATRARLELTVEDDGPGIAPEDREDAFRPFHRLDSARTLDGSGGTGLGLAIALDVARAHGGNLTLGEAGMGGLRAVLTLPR